MTVESLERVLREHRFFRDLRDDHVAAVTGCASNVRFEEGRFLFREGDDADRFYVLRQGRVAVEIFAPGRGAIAVDTLTEDDVLGFSWIFPPYKYRFDARALTSVRAFALDGTCLRQKCEADPVLGFELMRRFAQVAMQRLEGTQLQLLDLYGDRP